MKKTSLRWLLFLIPLIVLAPFINRFIYPKESNFSDLAITFYPNALYIHQSIFQNHAFPLWTDAILSGYPFSADPQAGLWYLPMWLVNVLPSPITFNLLIIFHLILAGVGMFLFLKQEGLHDLSALAGGLLFELMPKLWAHFGAGHISLVMAVCWTPWLLLAEKNFLLSGYSLKRMVYPAIVLGLIILCNATWAPFAFLIWVAYAFATQLKTTTGRTLKQRIPGLAKRLGWGVVQALIGLLISAPIWLPLITFTRLSSRVLMTTADSMAYSLPLISTLFMFIPDFSMIHELVIYPGIITFFFITWLLFSRRKPALTIFWFVVSGISLIVSFGENLPLIPLLYRLPFFNLLRVPTRFYFLCCLSMAILAAFGIEQFSYAKEKATRGLKRLWLGFGCFVGLLSLGIGLLIGKLEVQYFWTPLFIIFSLILLLGSNRFSRTPRVMAGLVVALMLIDVYGVDLLSLKFRHPREVFAEGSDVADNLAAQSGKFRTYSPSYSLPQQTAAKAGIQLADGVNPLQLMRYVDFMEQATGIPVIHYSVTLPDYITSNPGRDNIEYQPNAHLLGLLNVRFVLSAFDLKNADLTLVKTFDGTRIYENRFWMPRAWVQSVDAPLGEHILSVTEMILTPNTVTLSAEGPGLLVLSEIAYPGWRVTVNGTPLAMLEPMGLLRGVEIPKGINSVRFDYRPMDVFIGLGMAWIGWIAILVFNFLKSKSHSIDGK